MKLNASYTLGTGTSVDPAYLAPSFGLLSDSSDTLTSSTKVLGSSNSALYSNVGNGRYISTAESSIVMDLGSIKAVGSLRIKGSFALEYTGGQFVPSSNNSKFYAIGRAADVTANYGLINNLPKKLIVGDSGIYDQVGDLEYFIMNSNYDCSASFPSIVSNNTPKFFGDSPTARYKIQYSITGVGFLDFQDNIIDTPLNKNIDLTINIPSTIGSTRYLKLTLISTTSQPRFIPNIAYKSNSTTNIGYRILDNYSQSLFNTSITTYPQVSITLLAATDVPYVAIQPKNASQIFSTSFQYSTSDTGTWNNIIVDLVTTYVDTVLGNWIVYKFNGPPTGVKRIRVSVYDSARSTSSSLFGEVNDFYAATKGCLMLRLSETLSGAALAAGTTIQTTTGNILNSAMTLSEFYADDGVTPPSITFTNGTEDRTIVYTDTPGAPFTIYESWTVTSGTTTWSWQVQPRGLDSVGSTWTDWSPSGGSGPSTDAKIALYASTYGTPFGIANGNKYRVVVRSSEGIVLGTGRITTLTVPTPVITINSAILPSSYQLGDPALVLSVAASVSPSQTLSYKWQKKLPGSVPYADIGSVSPTLTIPTSDLQLVDSGISYRVVVSSAGADDVSREVTINVTEPQPTLIIDALINNAPAVLYNNIIEEGQTLKLDITAKNITANAVYWKIASDPTIQGNPAGGQDIEGGTIGGALPLSTATSITSPRTASLSLIVLKDNLTEGNELLQLEFYSNATYSSSALLTRSNIYIIKDTSIGSQPPPNPSSSAQLKTECFEIGFKNLITKTPTRTQTSTQTPTMTKTPSPTNTRTPRVLPTNEPTKIPPGSPTPTRTPTPTKVIDCWAPGSGGGNTAYAVVPDCPDCRTAVLIGKRKVILLDGSNCWEWIWDCVYIPDCEPTAIP